MQATHQSLEHESLGRDVDAIHESLVKRLKYSVGKDLYTSTPLDWLNVAAYMVRDRMMERWMDTMRAYYRADAKRVYYLSLEFLMGRTLGNSLLNLDIENETRVALERIGLQLENIAELENDAGLGNGGLGRLAACFLDSMATLNLPGYGYGIRYEYGMFNQRIEGGRQIEHPDNWLRYGNPWEFPRAEVLYPVAFGGKVIKFNDDRGELRYQWVDTDDVMAMAYDTPIPAYGSSTTNNMRLWSAKASRDFDLRYFNEGNYIKAVAEKNESENLSKVLYPDDTTQMGQELRLKQQYFFVSASLQDILRRYLKYHTEFQYLPDKVAIQLNDTHPAIAIPELMRILLDSHHLSWDESWRLTVATFAYTNHTLLPEALETWPVSLFESLLPRHLQIIYEINQRLLDDIRHLYPGDFARLRRMSIIGEEGHKHIRMAHLAVVGSHKVNGVSAIHGDLIRRTILADFHELYPGRFINITNGITPRRWLHQANPELTRLISPRLRPGWLADLEQLRELAPLAEDAGFREDFMRVKQANKKRLAGLIETRLGIRVDPNSMFDVQIKRIHEYKRQLLNVLHVITLYNRVRNGEDITPRTVIFSGKAAPGYAMAKLIIKLINDVADIVNNDPRPRDMLKIVFIPNYDVSTAMDIIPAADLSQQISTAGTEASGTGNMKLALNGALTIGTRDGANVEIAEAVGEENIFSFGLDAGQVEQTRANGYRPHDLYRADPRLREALDMIAGGFFCTEDCARFQPIIQNLLEQGDHYLLLADYDDYIAAQTRVEHVYRDSADWARRAILNVARMGKFSSDRAIREYAEKIWHAEAVVP